MRLSDPAAAAKRRNRLSAAIVLVGVLLGLALGSRYLGSGAESRASTTGGAGSSVLESGAYATLPPGAPTPNPESGGAPAVGRPAPDFTLAVLGDGEITLSDLKGRPVLINFWASWCPPCRVEMPDLVRAFEQHEDQGFIILGIDLTFQDSVPDVRAFVEEFEMSFPVLLDETGEVTAEKYRLLGLPMSVFVDREGIIRRIHIGAMTGEQIDEFVAEILQ